MMERDDEKTQMRYAQAITDYTDAGGYDIEVLWDTCTVAALGMPYDSVKYRDVATLSGGEQKRLVLEALLRGPGPDAAARRARQLPRRAGQGVAGAGSSARRPKTVLLVSHDRQLLANAADRIVTVESGGIWIHGGGFAHVRRGAQGAQRTARRAAPALGRGARQAQGAWSTC